ncbi:putative arsinothricin biosynthesis methyltransferase ArsM [Vogesella fluminis]|uniref:Methyltransferase domain-containing protein n=1 Tax=Vogesella fluminis TaxID=1069161 RepID=A0ABQ3HDW6_9NEIS|nr:putative arsinothricin biosynthesis methyltransferase ArsM [Vogesella fluminis]GHD81871.1 hypothetical protein GCM10011419_28580 [Vogesella fluminis]
MLETQEAPACCSGTVAKLDDRSQAIKDFYDSVARNEGPYAQNVDKFSPSAPTEKIISLANEYQPATVLDIGCGMGTTLLKLSPQLGAAKQLIGIDFSESMVERAKQERQSLSTEAQRKLGFFVANACSLPYMDGHFSFTYSECVFTLLPEREQAFREVFRVLDENGTFVYTDFVSTEEVPETVRNDLGLVSGCRAGAWTLDKNVASLKEAGFTSIEVIDFTEDKNARYAELRESSPQIAKEFNEFCEKHPESHSFLENKVIYVVIIAKKRAC